MNTRWIQLANSPGLADYPTPSHRLAAHIGLNIAIAAIVVGVVGVLAVWALEQLKDQLGASRPLVVIVTLCSIVLLIPITLQAAWGLFTGGNLPLMG